MKLLSGFSLLLFFSCSFSSNNEKANIYKQQANRVIIIRDDWGIPHIYGKTDADAVFGLMYAQCEESFERVERNYIEKLGRLSEIEGKDYLLQDLQMKLLYDTSAAIEDYKQSPQWLKSLLQSFSGGIHYYLLKHPETKPALITRFEPWFPLLFTDGAYIATQTGGLRSEDLTELFGKDLLVNSKIFFENKSLPAVGSNGFAIAPSRTADKTALLYINPHVSFYFRTEIHMVSEEGLNAYGAVTWGQFFVFQGFNEHCGWMHTSSAVDAADLYEEKIINKNDSIYYEYDGIAKPIAKKELKLAYKDGSGIKSKSITTYATQHGPIVGKRNGKWLSLKAMNRSLNGLIQSWQRTKAKSLEEFIVVMKLRSNPSTNTVYADNKGNIAYWHGNFIPKRDSSINPAYLLDGSSSKTEWQGMYDLNELIHVINPKEGFIQNCNSSPFSVSGFKAISAENYQYYMAPEGENFRSLYAIQQLSKQQQFTLDRLIAIGYSHYLPAFDTLIPPLLNDFTSLTSNYPGYAGLKEAIDSLKNWDRFYSESSIATTIAVFWGYTILSRNESPVPQNIINDQVKTASWIIKNISSTEKINALAGVLEGLEKIYGTWKVSWGSVNSFQRISGSLKPEFDNGKKSMPVGFASAIFGSLPSFETLWDQGKLYGVAGNSFVAAISFGPTIKAKSITTGGKSFSPSSKHFNDQSERFINGELKDVYFYKEDLIKHAEKTYHPGEE